MSFGNNRGHGWISWVWHDIRAILVLLSRRETWIFIGIAVVFGVLGGVSLYYATGLDVAMQIRHLQKISCSSASNVQSAAIIVGGAAFILAAISAFGELANFIDERRRFQQRYRVSGRNALLVTVAAIIAGAGLLWLLTSICG